MEQFITPIIKSNQKINENNIFIKREDLYPIAFGGNKARIVEKLIEDAKEKKCNHIVGYGSASSNMNRAVANLSSMNNLKCTVICSEEEYVSQKTNNSIMVQACGANIVSCLKTNVAETVESVCDNIRKDGDKPYYVYGDKFGKGNEVVTSKVYIDVYNEIVEQEKIGIKFDYIFLATGTGMTQAGLIIGNHIGQKKHKIVGISIARNQENEIPIIVEKINKFKDIVNLEDFNCNEVILYDKVVGKGYGQTTESLMDTIRNELVTDGIPLDITYTGKAFMGMKKYITEEKISGKNILFIHTGGTPLFWENINDIC